MPLFAFTLTVVAATWSIGLWVVFCAVLRLFEIGPPVFRVKTFGRLINAVARKINKWPEDAELTGFAGLPLFVILKRDASPLTELHEKIHFLQQVELLLFGWYILYAIFWLVYGYRENPMERAAYAYDDAPFSWVRYLKRAEA